MGGSWREREGREGDWRGSRRRMLIGAGLAIAIHPRTGRGVVGQGALLTRGNISMAEGV